MVAQHQGMRSEEELIESCDEVRGGKGLDWVTFASVFRSLGEIMEQGAG
jgi:hypothetical protein